MAPNPQIGRKYLQMMWLIRLVSKMYKQFIYDAWQHKNKQLTQKMGRRPEQTFRQRGHSDGQQVHEKIFNITSY